MSNGASEPGGDAPADDLGALIEAFRAGRGLGCDARQVRIIETHISYVALAGGLAYKFKKPVKFPFVDFGTLARRRHYLEEELRLNRRTAPSLYRRVVPIAGTPSEPVLDGAGEPFEYALEMVEFDQSRQLDRLLAADGLRDAHIDELAETVAEFHDRAARAGSERQGYGSPARIEARDEDNFESLEETVAAAPEADLEARLARLRAWSMATVSSLRETFEERRREGFVRECHGDLHLANIVLIEERAVPFDCIEFNEDFRWIDVASEIAFTVMDLDFHRRPQLGTRFLNRYLEHTGDYAALALLRHYLCYRALVRGKISGLRLRERGFPAAERAAAREDLRRHIDLAERYARREESVPLVITHGLSGSGKSWVAERLAAAAGAIRVRSDVERKRIRPEDLYSECATAQTYERLAGLARSGVAAGYPVIVDATFLDRGQRRRFERAAESLGAPFAILSLEAPEGVLRERIVKRAERGGDPSDATLEVLEHQMHAADPLGESEAVRSVAWDTTEPFDAEDLWARLCARAGSEAKRGRTRARPSSPAVDADQRARRAPRLSFAGNEEAHMSTARAGTESEADIRDVSLQGFPHPAPAEEKLRFLLRYAILAPSSHNTQPWRFALRADAVELHADRSRQLSVTDPEGRELIMSCGAALHHLRVAIEYAGYVPEVRVFPDSRAPDLLARITLGDLRVPSDYACALMLAMARRHTNRGPYEKRPVPGGILSALLAAAHEEGEWLHVVEGTEERHLAADLIAEADLEQREEPGFRRELAAWLRGHEDSRLDGIPYASLAPGPITSHLAPLLVRSFDWGGGRAAWDRQLAEGSPALLVLGSRADTVRDWLQAGQALSRVLLQACAEGLCASFFSQVLEVRRLRGTFASCLGLDGFPQAVLRMGYGKPLPPTPRRPVDEVLAWVS